MHGDSVKALNDEIKDFLGMLLLPGPVILYY